MEVKSKDTLSFILKGKNRVRTLIIMLLINIIVLIVSCGNSTNTNDPFAESYLHIERIDGCEYVYFRLSYAGGVVHHSACDNYLNHTK